MKKNKLRSLLADHFVDIEHIGSTAIPGVLAKPIINISMGVKRLGDAKKLISPLVKLGYNFYRPSKDEIFFAKGPDKKRTHYLHVVKYNGKKWKNDMLFKEYLLGHPKRVREYLALKRKLAKQFSADREKYTTGKKAFIQETLTLARK